MRQSRIFTKSTKDLKEVGSVNAALLQRGGFIDQTMAGVYTFLPLGMRVLEKIEDIIREEMNTVGTELLMPSLSPKELWQQTNRYDSMDVLMKATGANEASLSKNDGEYALNPTHEEIITPLAKKYAYSYRDLPFAVYQIQTKFRNEPRPKSGLLRCREFRMKDLYSFHASESDLQEYYEKVKKVYVTIFERLGLGEDTIIALASGGDFTTGYSHEFQTKCESGEDVIFYDTKNKIAYNKEVAPAQAVTTKENEEMALLENVKGEGIIGVEELSKFLKIPVEKTTKTILFENEKEEVIAAVVQGGYDVNELKLKKVANCATLQLASEKTVKKVTGAAVGYAGPLNLPKEVSVYFDDSTRGRVNFECGANKTNYHSINVNFGRDLDEPKEFVDIKIAKENDLNPATGSPYEVFTASEVGNIFPLNVKFSTAFEYTYTDKNGSVQPVYMGSYGIGPSRVMGVLVEKFHDDRGIRWPKQVAPFDVHVLTLGEEFEKRGEKLVAKLEAAGLSVLWDDRTQVTAGEKFADADLIGIPARVVLSKRTGGKVELKFREEDKADLVSERAVVKQIIKH